MSGATTRATTRGRMRRRWLAVGGLVFAVLVYAVVVLLYASSSVRDSSGDICSADDAVKVCVSPVSINGPNERMSLDVVVEAPDSLVTPDGVQMAEKLSVIIYPADGTGITLDKGSIPRVTKTISVQATGAAENWPFDRYRSPVAFIAFSGADQDVAGTPVEIEWKGSLSGWVFDEVLGDLPDSDGLITMADGTSRPIPFLDITASRSPATLAFGFVLLALLVAMPVLVFIVAVNAYTGRRKVEATLTSWMGAMLFATIPLRTFLPGSPPIGSWIDFLVVLWVIVALVTGLAIYVAAWYRWGTAATKP